MLENPEAYTFLYFLKINDVAGKALDVAGFVARLAAEEHCVVAFDRLLWSYLSSGQMPSQLYSFNFYGSDHACELHQGILVVASPLAMDSLPGFCELVFVEKLPTVSLDEGFIAADFEEDDFAACFYGSLLIWQKYQGPFPLIDQVRNIHFGHRLQLLIGKSLHFIDAWVEDYFNDTDFNPANKLCAAVHLFFPDNDKLTGLVKAVKDRESIHLGPEIKGIHC